MSSAWGDSWGNSWGDSWGTISESHGYSQRHYNKLILDDDEEIIELIANFMRALDA
jgi:hypothetical protein